MHKVTSAPPDTVELPGRRESLALLDANIPTLAEKTRTQINGIAKTWQPDDFLPNLTNAEVAFEDIRAIQRQARSLPPELLVVLVGDAITEDGLPLFTSDLFTVRGMPSGKKQEGGHGPGDNLKQWFRRWTAEEHRHGALLDAYLRLTGRVDMGAFERSVQLFLEDGLDVHADGDPYKGFVYTSFQELATQRSHANVARLAHAHGNPLLARICGQIAADEAYHARAYIAFVRTFFQRDPDNMMQALQEMLRRGIVMPAHNMREVDPSGNVLQPGQTYAYFSNVAQQTGVYTTRDYASISASLLRDWNVGQQNDEGRWTATDFPGLLEGGHAAQQKILRLQGVIERLASSDRSQPIEPRDTSWLIKKQD
ncbi:MAG: acyl-[acyl-carrier-protein] desaturase [Candidatus Peregrinibacteria bacterium Gr01-1014_25]|nr:MAG: acyl-[acyl-carrier-protein] desaturase [Candidatus Peregrinibacteria bacterium Gr01-1014_25]